MAGLTIHEWLNMSPRMGVEEATRLNQLGISVYFLPAVQKKLLGGKPFRLNSPYMALLYDVSDGHVIRPALSGMWDTNKRTWASVSLSIARLHKAGLVDLNSCPGTWYLTEAGRRKLEQGKAS